MNDKVNLWIVGSIGIDDIKTRDEDRKDLLGGSVTYCCAAASFFARTGAVGVVGTDFPEEFMNRYRRFGIDLAGLQCKEGSTFRWAGAYSDNMIDRTTLKTELGVFGEFSPELPESYRDAEFVLLGNIQPDLQLHVLGQARNAKFVAMDTMNLWLDIARESLLKGIAKVQMISLNDEEARLLTGLYHIRDCAEAILKMGPKYVAIKKGEHGSLLFSSEAVSIVPAYPVKAVTDPTGAGDTYAGAFMGYLAQKGRSDMKTLREALLYGSVMASFGVESFSLERLETLTSAEIEARLAELKAMIAF